jgi:hypothetical protein
MRTGRFLLIYGVALVVIAVLTILPLLSMMTATLLAGANDCPLNEGNPHPCPILGSDWGETLYNMSVAGWLMLFTLPTGVLLFIVWLVFLVVHLWRRRK